jgi:hypothetical protein
VLKRGSGRLDCTQCGRPFNALERLSDEYPDLAREAQRRRYEEDTAAQLEAGADGRAGRSSAGPALPAAPGDSANWPWYLAVAALCLITLVNIAWALRGELPVDSALAMRLHQAGVAGFAPAPEYRDPGRIHLVTRDIHPHPTRPGVLVLSATFVNLAEREQAYPGLTLSLLDTEGHWLAARQFEPTQYLAAESLAGAMLQPDQHVPMLLEFADPGEQAVGFELVFH